MADWLSILNSPIDEETRSLSWQRRSANLHEELSIQCDATDCPEMIARELNAKDGVCPPGAHVLTAIGNR